MEILLRHRRDVHRRRERLGSVVARGDPIDDAGTRSRVRDNSRCASVWPIGISRIAAETVAASRVYAIRVDRLAAALTPATRTPRRTPAAETGPRRPSLRSHGSRSSRASGCRACHVVSSRWPMARLERRALDDGRSAVSSSSSWSSPSTSPSATARQPCHTAGPSSRPIVSSRHGLEPRAAGPPASAIVPSLVALSKPVGVRKSTDREERITQVQQFEAQGSSLKVQSLSPSNFPVKALQGAYVPQVPRLSAGARPRSRRV